LQHSFKTLATHATSRSTFATSIRNTCNVPLKHLKHLKHIFAIYGREGQGRLIPASGREHHQHGPRSWAPLARPGTNLRHAMALYEHQQRRAARAQERAACVGARRVGLREQGARGAGGHARRARMRSEHHRVGARAGRWLWRLMRSEADGRPHGAVKRDERASG
jgi:hypothetical protein